jgi:hypothetical protein
MQLTQKCLITVEATMDIEENVELLLNYGDGYFLESDFK